MKIDHIGIAVTNLDRAAALYTMGLGLEMVKTETVSSQGVRVGFIPLDESAIELLEPLKADSPVGRFLEKHGEGMHHLCIEVEDIVAELARLKQQGVRLINEEPAQGAGGKLVAFVHPKSANGVLLELTQKPKRG